MADMSVFIAPSSGFGSSVVTHARAFFAEYLRAGVAETASKTGLLKMQTAQGDKFSQVIAAALVDYPGARGAKPDPLAKYDMGLITLTNRFGGAP